MAYRSLIRSRAGSLRLEDMNANTGRERRESYAKEKLLNRLTAQISYLSFFASFA